MASADSGRSWFRTQPVPGVDGVLRIDEPHYFAGNRANVYLLRGTSLDLLVDSGLGVCNLREYLVASRLIDADPDPAVDGARRRPLLCVCTHIHFDHSGGLADFDEVAVHSDEAEALSAADQVRTVTWMADDQFAAPPSPGFRASSYRVRPVKPERIRVLREGDTLDLGDRQLDVLSTPGHSPGSVCLLDRRAGLLFSGDTLYDGGLIDWLPGSDVGAYRASLSRLRSLEGVRTVLPGHYAAFGAGRMREIAEEYLRGDHALARAAKPLVSAYFHAKAGPCCLS
eukprot:tig00021290_g19973.t1